MVANIKKPSKKKIFKATLFTRKAAMNEIAEEMRIAPPKKSRTDMVRTDTRKNRTPRLYFFLIAVLCFFRGNGASVFTFIKTVQRDPETGA